MVHALRSGRSRLANKAGRDRLDPLWPVQERALERVVLPLSGLSSWVVVLAGGLMMLHVLGINVQPLLTVTGVSGIIVGLAAQSVMANMISGINLVRAVPAVGAPAGHRATGCLQGCACLPAEVDSLAVQLLALPCGCACHVRQPTGRWCSQQPDSWRRCACYAMPASLSKSCRNVRNGLWLRRTHALASSCPRCAWRVKSRRRADVAPLMRAAFLPLGDRDMTTARGAHLLAGYKRCRDCRRVCGADGSRLCVQFISRPFVVGDRIDMTTAGGARLLTGYIEAISPMRTILRTDAGTPFMLPNKGVSPIVAVSVPSCPPALALAMRTDDGSPVCCPVQCPHTLKSSPEGATGGQKGGLTCCPSCQP